ncbi:MAG: P1 family peptidase [Acidobacteriota bacterium]
MLSRRSLLLAFLADPPRRPRDFGIISGQLPPGPLNAITDVSGVLVGQITLLEGPDIRTGVTVVLPHSGNLFRDKVRAAIHVGNGFGKLMGSTQVNELGEIESPIALTSTLNVPRVADALLDYLLALPGNEAVRSINVVVGETNDGQLNNIRARRVGAPEVLAAIRSARSGPVEEGGVGAGTGTICFGWKGGIGTSSRQVSGHTVGVLVQSNYGGDLRIAGMPFPSGRPGPASADGSIMIVVATDAPLEHRALSRLASRAIWGLGRTGSTGSNGSGDYAIAFSTFRNPISPLRGDLLSPLFQAVIEATEEAVLNSLFLARTIVGNGLRVEALPVDRVVMEWKRRNGQ